MAEVAKHTTKGDCWVVVAGQVLNVTNFLPSHPGGELAILTFAGKDATEEFNMIHPPDVIGKYAPEAVIGVLGAGGGGDAKANEPAAGHVAVEVVPEVREPCDCLKGRTYDDNVGLVMKSCLAGAAFICWYTIHYYVQTGGL